MSAFIVADNTINVITEGAYSLDEWDVRRLGLPESRPDFAQQLYSMNVEAVRQRYDDEMIVKMIAKEKVSYRRTRAHWAVVYKAACCLQYQCTEGNVDTWSLYKTLDRLIILFAAKAVETLPEYQAAPWE